MSNEDLIKWIDDYICYYYNYDIINVKFKELSPVSYRLYKLFVICLTFLIYINKQFYYLFMKFSINTYVVIQNYFLDILVVKFW